MSLNSHLAVAASTMGSMLTTEEEATNLANNSKASSLIKKASSLYEVQLNAYRSKSITFDQLTTEYSTIFANLLTNIKSCIAADTTGLIQPIENSYDDNHQDEYLAHLKLLIGLSQNLLSLPAYLCLLPPNSDYTNLIKNGDFSSGVDGWVFSAGGGNVTLARSGGNV